LNNRAHLHDSRGDTAGALSDVDAALELSPRHAGLRRNRAVLLEKLGAQKAALGEVDRAIRRAPDDAPAPALAQRDARMGARGAGRSR